MAAAHLDATRRHDFVFMFDVVDGNPNGDPDAGNQPRTDLETQHGIVTDVSTKRKIRDYVDVARGDQERYKIYVQRRSVLTEKRQRAYAAAGITPVGTRSPDDASKEAEVRDWMCANFYDIRAFGAVMALQANCGQVRGPMQLTFARSVDRIAPQELAIVRVAVESTRMGEGHDGGDGEAPSYRGTMGRRSVVPYALYRGHGFYSPHSAKLTGFDDDDMSLFWEALAGAWELDRSSARGMMSFRGAYVFSHDNPLGNAPAHALFERITTARTQTGVESPPRAFSDYTVHARSEDMPNGVALATLGVE